MRSFIHLDRSRIRTKSLRRFATSDAVSGARSSHHLRCFASASLDALLCLSWSHPLESNQNLSSFDRARRPTTLGRDVGAARVVGDETNGATALLIIVQLFNCHGAATRCAMDAPRASMHARMLGHVRMHLSRFEITSVNHDHESKRQTVEEPARASSARNEEGPLPVLGGGPA